MGAALSLFGKINEESPTFSLLKKTAEYEIRRYAKATAVETTYEAVWDFFVLYLKSWIIRNFNVNRNTCWEVKGRVSCPWRSTLAWCRRQRTTKTRKFPWRYVYYDILLSLSFDWKIAQRHPFRWEEAKYNRSTTWDSSCPRAKLKRKAMHRHHREKALE